MTLPGVARNVALSALFVTIALIGWLLLSPWRARGQGTTRVASVSAASYSTIVAPEQIVAGFSANLAVTRSNAQDFDPSAPGIQLPTLLGGASVEVNGRSAGLFFVSPNQINFQTPPDLEQGTGYVTGCDFALM